MVETKIIANYLPQFHAIPENDLWWGKGYTDWNAVKNSKSLFTGHTQPTVPLDNNYYDLSEKDNIKWQAELARQYGVYGFGIYHYWFNSEMHLLETPSEIILNNKDIDINYCFIWDNSTWKRTWSNVKFSNDWGANNNINDSNNSQNGILAELIYGTELDWKIHFDYLLKFFKDDRYIKINNKPIFGIYNQDNGTEDIEKFINYWDLLAKEQGFDGICILGKRNQHGIKISELQYDYEPLRHGWIYDSFCGRACQKIRNVYHKKCNKVDIYNYDKIWRRIIKDAKKCNDSRLLYGAFVSYDDTPRRGHNGKIIVGKTPVKFEKYLADLLKIASEQNKEYIILTAWNEWGEGAYLEPDEENEYAYLEALRNAVKSVKNEV